MKNRKHFLLGAGIIVFPVVIFYMLNVGIPQYGTLPIFGEKIEPNGADVKDTIYYQIPNFKVVNQLGDTITQENLNDGIYLANFFFKFFEGKLCCLLFRCSFTVIFESGIWLAINKYLYNVLFLASRTLFAQQFVLQYKFILLTVDLQLTFVIFIGIH